MNSVNREQNLILYLNLNHSSGKPYVMARDPTNLNMQDIL
jgi:hypothetical protein